MKAIRVHEFGGPEVLKLEDVPSPQVREGQVLVRIRAIGVNPADTYIRAGRYAVRPTLPYTPGMDAGGTVDSVGSGVTRVKVGDRVYVAGSLTGVYAELALCSQDQVWRLPDNISFEEGAAVHVPYATAYRALFQKAFARPGEAVLVHGASGGVGVAAVQLARAAGLLVIGTAGTETGAKLVIEQGAHHCFNHHSADYLDQIAAVTGGRGVNVTLEMLANVNLAKDLGLMAPGGRIVVIGSRGTIEIDPRMAMSRDATVIGMALLNEPDADRFAIHSALVAGLESGILRPVVGRRLQLSEAARAHEAVLEPGAHGKIVLTV